MARLKTPTAPSIEIPSLGKVKIGDRSPKTGAPRSLDYFRVDRDTSPKYHQAFQEAYGEQPTILKIYFPSMDAEKVMNHRIEGWDKKSGRRRLASCDGERVEFYGPLGVKDIKQTATVDYSMSESNDPIEALNAQFPDAGITWKHVLTMRFMLPQVGAIMGTWELNTGAIDASIYGIISSFDQAVAMCRTQFGEDAPAFFPKMSFDLMVHKHSAVTGSGTSRSFPVLTMVFNMSTKRLAETRQLALQSGSQIAQHWDFAAAVESAQAAPAIAAPKEEAQPQAETEPEPVFEDEITDYEEVTEPSLADTLIAKVEACTTTEELNEALSQIKANTKALEAAGEIEKLRSIYAAKKKTIS